MPSENFGPFVASRSVRTLDGTEALPVVVSDVTEQTTLDAIADFLNTAQLILTTGVQYPNAQPFGNSDNSLNYPDGNTLIDSGNSLYLDTSGGQFFDTAGAPRSTGNALIIDVLSSLPQWNYLQYASGNPMTDASSNLYLDSSGGQLLDAIGSAGTTGQLLLPGVPWLGNGPNWEYPQYANGSKLTDWTSTLYGPAGAPLCDAWTVYYPTASILASEYGLFSVGGWTIADNLDNYLFPVSGDKFVDGFNGVYLQGNLYDATGSPGTAGQVLTIDPTTLLPTWS